MTVSRLMVAALVCGFLLAHATPGRAQPSPGAATVRTQFVEVGGRKLAYRSIGQGKPIVLSNRFRGNLDSWDPAFLDALAEHYRVITFNHSGFGLSTGTPNTTMLGFAKDVKDLAAALRLDTIIMGGWSFGGLVAQIVTTEYPELVSHTILIGTNPPGANQHPVEQVFLDTAYKVENSLEDEIVLFFEPASAASREAARRSHMRIASRTVDRDIPLPRELWESFGKGVADVVADPYNARTKLSTTNIPILVISADHEICFPAQNWYALTRQLPTTQLLIIPQAGHGPHHQHPQMTAAYIRQFIEQAKIEYLNVESRADSR